MNLCSEGHDEVCYESKNCPVCELLAEITGLQQIIETLEEARNEWLNRNRKT